MSESIQSSQLKIASDMEHMIRSSRSLASKTESISEISSNASARMFIAQYETPQFPKLPENINKEYWENFQDKFEWSIRGETQILMDSVPFGEGKTSLAFKIEDRGRELQMVGKIDKKVFNHESSDDF